MNRIDWNLLRSFTAVAEAGSLSAAARALSLSQPTLGRHVAELEAQLGLSLFRRHPRGLALTERGAALYDAARGIGDQVDAIARAAVGLDERIEGTVRVSASEVVAHFVLPGRLVELRRRHPGIALEIVADDRPANLLGRDADIAVRMFRPEQQELVAKRVGEAPVGLYASTSYVAEHGDPQDFAGVFALTVLGLDQDGEHLRATRTLGLTVRREDFTIRSDAQGFHIHAAEAGLGVAAIQTAIAERRGGLVRLLPDLTIARMPVWVVAHADVQRSPRVRAAFDVLAEGLRAFYAEPTR